MSIRTALARWLAPEVFREADIHQIRASEWRDDALFYRRELLKIASQRTQGANSTVKRMADIAEAALAYEGSAG